MMSVMVRPPRSRFWLSYLYVVIGGVLLLGGFLTLWPIRHTPGFGTQLRLNIGSNLLDLVLAVLVLQPLIISLNRNAVRWRNRLDYREVIRRIDEAESRVDLWKFWTGLLEPPHEQAFATAVGTALRRGVHFRILLTDPSSADAAERARQVSPVDAQALMRQNIERLDALVRSLPAREAELFRVRISATGPAHAIYRVDDWLSYGLFRDRRVSESGQRQVRVHGDLGALAMEAFDNRWRGAGLRELAAHFRLPVDFTVRGKTVTHQLPYVIHDGEHWVNVHPDALEQAFHPEHEVTVRGDGPQRYVLTAASPETMDRIEALYTAKYGPDSGAVLRRLTHR